jgi:hypothetical protein
MAIEPEGGTVTEYDFDEQYNITRARKYVNNVLVEITDYRDPDRDWSGTYYVNGDPVETREYRNGDLYTVYHD